MSFGEKETHPQKERQECSFRNCLQWQKGTCRKGQFCNSKGMQKSEFLPTQKDRGAQGPRSVNTRRVRSAGCLHTEC